jgi:hypothetical protein
MINLNIYQLINVDGEHIGLFTSKRIDANVNVDIRNAIIKADGDPEIYNEILEEKEIYPVWAEAVYTDHI